MMKRWLIVFASSLFCLVALAQGEVKTYLPPTLDEAMAVQQQGRYLATMVLERGITIELVLEGAFMPLTVANIKKLADAHFYDNLTFHRVLPQTIVQTGDPFSAGTDREKIGNGGPGYTINLELSPFLAHKPGAVAMAYVSSEFRNYPNSGGSHFFILHPDISPATLNYYQGLYGVFGWVKGDIDVIDTISLKDRIKSFTVAPYDGDDPCPLLIPGTALLPVETPEP